MTLRMYFVGPHAWIPSCAQIHGSPAAGVLAAFTIMADFHVWVFAPYMSPEGLFRIGCFLLGNGVGYIVDFCFGRKKRTWTRKIVGLMSLIGRSLQRRNAMYLLGVRQRILEDHRDEAINVAEGISIINGPIIVIGKTRDLQPVEETACTFPNWSPFSIFR